MKRCECCNKYFSKLRETEKGLFCKDCIDYLTNKHGMSLCLPRYDRLTNKKKYGLCQSCKDLSLVIDTHWGKICSECTDYYLQLTKTEY